MSWLRVATLVVSVALWLTPRTARAHPLAPAALHLREQEPQRYGVQLVQPTRALLTPSLPSDCRLTALHDDTVDGRRETRYVAHCAAPLDGRNVGLQGLVAHTLSGLVLVERSGGPPLRAVLDARTPSVRVPIRASLLQTVGDYGALGARHLLEGADHVAFVVGLFLLAERRAALLWALTAFTLGHSLTLALAALSWLNVPSRAAELGIALSIVLLGLELEARARAAHGPRKAAFRGVVFAVGCGLLHGLGFAGALAELGFPVGARAACLGAFNVGLELAQLGLVLGLWLCTLGALRLAPGLTRTTPWPLRVAAHGLGALGVYWCLGRLG